MVEWIHIHITRYEMSKLEIGDSNNGDVHELPAEPQTFALQNSRDMLKKLRWEIDELRLESGYPGKKSHIVHLTVRSQHGLSLIGSGKS
jgi:hypothetical protein